MSDFLPPSVARLVADITGYMGPMQAATAETNKFVDAQAKMDLASKRAGLAAEQAAARAAAAQAKAAAAAEAAAKGTISQADAEKAAQEAAFANERAQLAQAQATLKAADASKVQRDAMIAQRDAANASGGATAKVLLGVGAAAVAVGVETVRMASQFDASMELLHTQAGAPQSEVDNLKNKVLDLAGVVGFSPNSLAEALYHVESVGYRENNAIAVLTAGAKEAAIAHSNLDDTIYSLTSTMKTYGDVGVAGATKDTAALNAIVGQGDMRFQDLNDAIQTGLLSTMQTFGVSIESTGAALAYLTDRGEKANTAATRLSMGITLMEVPSKKAQGVLHDLGVSQQDIATGSAAMTEALKKSGLTQEQLASDLRKPDGIYVALEDLKKKLTEDGIAAQEQGAIIASIFGGARTGKAIMALYESLDQVQQKFVGINNAESQWGQDFQATQQTLTQRWHEFVSTLEADGIRLGEVLSPLASTVLDALDTGLKTITTDGGKVVSFFTHSAIAAGLLGSAISVAALPQIIKLGLAARTFVDLKLAAAFEASAGGIEAIGAAIASNPEMLAIGAAFAAAGAIVELFGHKEAAAAVDVGGLTQALKDQAAGGFGDVTANILDQMNADKLGSRGETILQYLQRYKIDVGQVVNDLAAGNANAAQKLMLPILNDPSVNPQTQGKLYGFYLQIAGAINSYKAGVQSTAAAQNQLKAALESTASGRFAEWMQTVSVAQGQLASQTTENNKTLAGQVDLLKQYKTQADITAQSIQQHLLDNIRMMAQEGDDLRTLAANGVSGDFIAQLYKEGPEYVAAVAGASKSMQLQLSALFDKGSTQLVHTGTAAAKAELPQAAQTVADATTFFANAQKQKMQAAFYGAVQAAVDQARALAASGGDDTTGAFGIHAEAGKNAVLQHMLAALPDPVRQATEAALGIATTDGGKIPQNLAAAINAHNGVVEQAAEALRASIQGKIDSLHDKTITIHAVDHATSLLDQVKNVVASMGVPITVQGFGNLSKLTNPQYQADGGLLRGPGGPRGDKIPVMASDGEFVVNAAATAQHLPLLHAINSRKYADGGLIQLYGTYLDPTFDTTNLSKRLGSMISGASGGSASGAMSSGSAVALGRVMAAAYGWVGPMFDALNKLWTRESGWNPNAVNPSSGAYGIPQALGHGHPFNLGDAASQIAWGLQYILGRYGNPLNAWAHETAVGWYHNGGMIPGRGNVPIMALGGEGVLNRAGVAAAGGPAGVAALNTGGSRPIIINLHTLDTRTMQTWLRQGGAHQIACEIDREFTLSGSSRPVLFGGS